MVQEYKMELADKLTNVLQENHNQVKDNILGKVLTIVEAAIVDEKQLKAVKDLIRQCFWGQGSQEEHWHIVNSFLDKYGKQELSPSDYWIDHRHDIPRSSYFE